MKSIRRIGIVGGGFSGTMTAVNLIRETTELIQLIIINQQDTFNKGVAFNPYSKGHLLNVITSKMSAFDNTPSHFLEWVKQRDAYQNLDRSMIGNSFLPRYLYGQYLQEIWSETIFSFQGKNAEVTNINARVVDLEVGESTISLLLSNDKKIEVDSCVIASGNLTPRNPDIRSKSSLRSKRYFQNPWTEESVNIPDPDSSLPVLIIGNGLTMIDTVSGLLEKGFSNTIYSISPNGFNILPHRHNGMEYTGLKDELAACFTLLDIVRMINKHIKKVRALGISAEPIIDAVRPHAQTIWQKLTPGEKRLFMARLRHLWGVARHRIPLHIHDKIQQLRIEGKLIIYAGKLSEIKEETGFLKVELFNKRRGLTEHIKVARVINCTGPETDLARLDKCYLKNCLQKGILVQDELKLGIAADAGSFQVIDAHGHTHDRLYTVGTMLRGVLWESTAVAEIRVQASRLAKIILNSPLQKQEPDTVSAIEELSDEH